MKVKITKIACKLAISDENSKYGTCQKKGPPSAKYIRQIPCLPRFYAISKLEAITLLQRAGCKLQFYN